MDIISYTLSNMFRDNASMLMALLVFLTGTAAFSLMAFLRVRGAVKRRAVRLTGDTDERGNPTRSLRYSSLKAVTQLLEYTTKHYADTNDANMKALRRRLIQAGIYDPRGVAFFFIARTAFAVGLALLLFLFLPLAISSGGAFYWLMVSSAASPDMSRQASISTGAFPPAKWSTAAAFRISWTCWWYARIQACRWKPRSSASAASSATAIRR